MDPNEINLTEAQVKERLAWLEKRRFDINKKPEFEEACFTIEDHMGTNFRVGNFGHLGVVTGTFGSRKTTCSTGIVAAALSNRKILNFKVDIQGKNVLFIDTEQPEDTHYEVMSRIYQMCGWDKSHKLDNFYSYSIKPLNYQDRLLNTDILIKNIPNLGLVVIDGIVDLINSINDEVASRAMLDQIAWWTDTLKPLVVTVIHTNKDGVNERGFIGGFLADKANFILKTILNEDTNRTAISYRKGRYGPFPSFEISHDKNGMPISAYEDLPF